VLATESLKIIRNEIYLSESAALRDATEEVKLLNGVLAELF
jgi:hypothetical protein